MKLGYIYFNPNPIGRQSVGDCTVRAISKAMNWDWYKTYVALCVEGMQHCEMPSANEVWGSFLLNNGFEEHSLMLNCKDCYSLIDFCRDYPNGEYLVGTGEHIVYVSNGDYWDSWDSGTVVPTYYFSKNVKGE